MRIDVAQVPLDEIRSLRDQYRKEMNCQVVHDSWHERGFTDSYLIRVNGKVAGYGSVGAVRKKSKDTIKEFYLLAEHRGSALKIFRRIIEASQATKVEAQTNDLLLTLMLFDCARRIKSDTILFHDAITTSLECRGGEFRRATDADQKRAFPHTTEPVGDWIIEAGGEVAATGGILFHYNIPYGGHLHGSGRVIPAARIRQLPGSGVEAHVLRDGPYAGRTLQRIECGFEGNASKSWLMAVRTNSQRRGFGVTAKAGRFLAPEKLKQPCGRWLTTCGKPQ